MGYPKEITTYAIEQDGELIFFDNISLDYDNEQEFIFCRAESCSTILAPTNLKNTFVLICKEYLYQEAEIIKFDGTFAELFDVYLNENFDITVSRL